MTRSKLSRKGMTKSKLYQMNGGRNPTPWSRNGSFLTTPSMNLTPGWPRIVVLRLSKTSPWRRWNPPLVSSRTSSRRRKGSWRISKSICCPFHPSKKPLQGLDDAFRHANVFFSQNCVLQYHDACLPFPFFPCQLSFFFFHSFYFSFFHAVRLETIS